MQRQFHAGMKQSHQNIKTMQMITPKSFDLDPLPFNWRDVGLSLCLRCASDSSVPVIPCGKLLRCGVIGYHHRRADLGLPNTIINLRESPDHHLTVNPTEWKGVTFLHIPSDGSVRVYNASNRGVLAWLNISLRAIGMASPPFLIHCHCGTDRTGVLVAAILMAVGVPDQQIIEEYALSQGSGICLEHMKITVALLRHGWTETSPPLWLRGVNVGRLRSLLCGNSDGFSNKVSSREDELEYITARLLNLNSLFVRARQESTYDFQALSSLKTSPIVPICRIVIDLAERKVQILKILLKIGATTGKYCHGALRGICLARSRQGGAHFKLREYESAHFAYDLAIEAGWQCPELSSTFIMRLSHQRQYCQEYMQDNTHMLILRGSRNP